MFQIRRKQQVLEEIPEGWLRLNFKLLQKNWQFANFSIMVRPTDPMLIVQNKFIEQHGPIKNLHIYLDVERNCELSYVFTDTVRKVLESASDQPQHTDCHLYYDFDNGYSCPLLLF